ncbi:MAG TPA: DUF5668 domain-containing protein [Thermoanaerobaculia bacterium]|nr:DUF5668 domain-containing protein [Thermoanaerobaculia bacterium]
MNNSTKRNVWMQLAWGALLLTVGIIFWLDRIGRLDARDYVEYWPVAVIVIGLAHLPQRRWFGAAVWTGVGVLFLMRQLGFDTIAFWQLIGLWPLLISLGGVTLIRQALRPKPAGTMFSAAAVMAGNVLHVGSQEFAGADLVAVMGGCDVDLSSAKAPRGEIEIYALAFWGGIEIRVPRGWRVESHVAQILGGFEDKTVGAAENATTLIVRGSAIMGGIEVKHSAEASA